MSTSDKNKFKAITIEKAMELSDGYFTNKQSIKNLFCRGRLKRYGPPKRPELNYYEFMEYMGRPA